MATLFLSGQSPDVKPYIAGTSRERRYPWVNSRNHNLKVIRSGDSVTTQRLGIDFPLNAPTGVPGTGLDLFYVYVYVNKNFTDPLAQEADDPFIRSNSSPQLQIASQTTPATNIQGTVSTDPQVTHLWLYVGDGTGLFYRLLTNYEQPNTGTPTWPVGVTSVPTTGYLLEIDNSVPDTCRVVEESNGFYFLGGFIPITNTGTVLIGGGVITMGSTVYDGIVALFLQFSGDTSGGPYKNGIFIVNYIDATHVQIVNLDGTNGVYDGPSNKTTAPLRIWRDASVVQITKRYNPDAIPGVVDPDFLIRVSGKITGIAAPSSGFVLRLHYNDFGRKSVYLADVSNGVPVRIIKTSSPYSMACPRAYAAAGNRLFYFDIAAGFVEDQGINHKSLSQMVIPNLMRSLNSTSIDTAEMEYDEYRNLLFLACAPPGYTRNHFFIVYNLTTQTFNLWFMVPDVNAMRKIYDSNGIPSIYCGSSFGSVTIWPSTNFNEAVGTSQNGVLGANDDATHLTVVGTPFPVTGDKLKDRWVMTWTDAADIPVYQFARISDNTSSRLTLDTFIGPNSTTGFSPLPLIGDAYWVGPIQAILGPNWDFNSVPDSDGELKDVSISTSGVDANMVSKISLYRNLEPTPSIGSSLAHNLYADSSVDTDHQSFKAGVSQSIEATGITGWQVTDNNETPMSIKALIKRVRQISKQVKPQTGREQ